MPVYIYEHPTTLERIEVVQHMNDEHVFEKDGISWKRVFEAPNTNLEPTIGKLDPFNKKEFMDKTGKMRNITQGDLWDLSKELSDKRKKVLGKDPVKEKAVKAYERKCGGKRHPHANS